MWKVEGAGVGVAGGRRHEPVEEDRDVAHGQRLVLADEVQGIVPQAPGVGEEGPGRVAGVACDDGEGIDEEDAPPQLPAAPGDDAEGLAPRIDGERGPAVAPVVRRQQVERDRRSLARPRRGEGDRRSLQRPGEEPPAVRLAENEAPGFEEGSEVAPFEQAGPSVEVRFGAPPASAARQQAGKGPEGDEGADDEAGEGRKGQGGRDGVVSGEVACDVAFKAGMAGDEKEGGARGAGGPVVPEQDERDRGGDNREVKRRCRAGRVDGDDPENRRGGQGEVAGGADHRPARWGRRMEESRATLPVASAVTRPAPSSRGTGGGAEPLQDHAGQGVDEPEGAVHQRPGDHRVEHQHGQEPDRIGEARGLRALHLGHPERVQHLHGGKEDEGAENEPEHHQRRHQHDLRQEHPALARRGGDEAVPLLAADVEGGEEGDREHRFDDRDEPGEDAEEEADEGKHGEDVGEGDAGDQQHPQKQRDEPVGDAPHGLEGVERRPDHRNALQEVGSRRGAGQHADGRQRGGDEFVTEGREIDDRVVAGRHHGDVEADDVEEVRDDLVGRVAGRCRSIARRRRREKRRHLGSRQPGEHALHRSGGGRRPPLQVLRRQRHPGHVARRRLEPPGLPGERVEGAAGPQPALRTVPRSRQSRHGRIVALRRTVEGPLHVRAVVVRQPVPREPRIRLGQRLAVGSAGRCEVTGKLVRHRLDGREQAGEGVAVRFGEFGQGRRRLAVVLGRRRHGSRQRPASCLRVSPEGDGAAQLVGHVAAGSGVAAHGGVGFDRDERGAAGVGDMAAGLRHQDPCQGGAAQVFARLRAHRPHGRQIPRHRLPHRMGEVAAEAGEGKDDVLGAVETAGKRRHQRHGGDDAHDLPASEAPASLAGRVECAGHALVDQQRAGQHHDPGVVDEQHVGEARCHAVEVEESEETARGVVFSGEETGIHGLGDGPGGHAGEDENGEDRPGRRSRVKGLQLTPAWALP